MEQEMKSKNIQELAGYFKALSNPKRLKLFLMVSDWAEECDGKSAKGGCCSEGVEKAFTRVCEKLNLSRSTISHHFNVLENAGLISCKRDQRQYICTVNEKALREIRKTIR
jgi:DNA-binding transcriptional ArsR family regulator